MINGQQYSETKNIVSKFAEKTVYYHMNEMQFLVRVLDIRVVWNRTDLLITPINGLGSKWVEASKCKLVA